MTPTPFAVAVDLNLPLGALLLLAVVLLASSFLFSGTETAMFSLQKVDRQRFANGTRTERRVTSLLQRRAALITTILIGNETANVLLASTGAQLFSGFSEYPWADRWINILVVTPILVLLSEITPKVLAFRFNTTWARLIAWPLSVFTILVGLPRILVSFTVSLMARLFGVTAGAMPEGLHESELLSLLDQGAAAGNLEERERDLIENVFEFDDLTVARVMTPRPDLIALPIDIAWDVLLERCRATGFSRIPIYEGRVEDIVGVLLVKDLLKVRERPPASPQELRALLLPPTFVPQSKSAEDMLSEFLEQNHHLAFVVDEHGTLVGLITLDDLLDELFGEFDEDDDTTIERPRPGLLTVKAGMDIEDFAEETGVALPPGDYHTVGGFVFHHLGRLPRRGDEVYWEGNSFRVRTMDGRRVAEVSVELAKTALPAQGPTP